MDDVECQILLFILFFSQASKVQSAHRCKNMKKFHRGKSLKEDKINQFQSTKSNKKEPWFRFYNDSIRIILNSYCTQPMTP